MSLVLSLFSGLGVLDHGFRLEGFCVVSAGDVVRSTLDDVRDFHPPAGVFDGVIGGDPCQSHSALANLVRAKGLEPSFQDMTGEFQRIVEAARPRWFLRENVPGALDVKLAGYDVRSFLLDHSTLDRGDSTGHEQMRRRRFWFGTRDRTAPELRAYIDFALFVLPDVALTVNAGHDHLDGAERIVARRVAVHGGIGHTPSHRDALARKQAVTADPRAVPVALGGSGKLKRENAPRYSLAEMLDLQGLPPSLLEHSPFTMEGKRKLVGNAVALGMARALARAVRKTLP